jgi:ribose 1,5-bisphosphokinase PhnN
MITLPFIPGSERLLVVVGPSGAGKDSVLAAWRHRLGAFPVHFAQRVISRQADANEQHEPISACDFARAVAAGELATWWHAHGLSYGLRWRELSPMAQARWVVVNGSREHLPALRRQGPISPRRPTDGTTRVARAATRSPCSGGRTVDCPSVASTTKC